MMICLKGFRFFTSPLRLCVCFFSWFGFFPFYDVCLAATWTALRFIYEPAPSNELQHCTKAAPDVHRLYIGEHLVCWSIVRVRVFPPPTFFAFERSNGCKKINFIMSQRRLEQHLKCNDFTPMFASVLSQCYTPLKCVE